MSTNLSVADRFTIFNWLKDNEKELSLVSADKAVEILKADTGFNLSAYSVRKLAHDGKLSLWPKNYTRKKPNLSDRHTREAEIAKAIRFISQELGLDLPNIEQINAMPRELRDEFL